MSVEEIAQLRAQRDRLVQDLLGAEFSVSEPGSAGDKDAVYEHLDTINSALSAS